MKFINKSKNTIYLADINKHIPYLNDIEQEIKEDEILRSKGFQAMVLAETFEIKSIEDTRIENNLYRLKEKMAVLKQKILSPNKEENISLENQESKELEVLIKGHFFEAGGYAKVNRNLALALQKRGVKVIIESVGNKNHLTDEEMYTMSSLRGKPNKNTIRIDSMIPSFGNCSSGRNSILYTTVESYSIPKQFLEVANNYKEIWVTSDFSKDILIKSGLKRPIYVFPCTVDVDSYTSKGDKYEFRPELKDFVFVSVFGWSYRKGFDVLLKSYLKAFTDKDNVSLLLVSRYHNTSEKNDIIRTTIDSYCQQYGGKNVPHIVRCSKVIPENKMPSLYRSCNAFVLFTRGEGFGMPLCESSLCGLPVISTNCSGQAMFLNHDNSYLLDPDSFAPVQSGLMHVHYWDEQVFPVLTSYKTIEGASQLMRYVYENPNKAKEKNKKLQNLVKKEYSIDTVVDSILERLKQIWSV